LSQPLSTEEFNTVLNAIFDEQISDEVLVETFTAVLDTPLTQERFAEVVNVLSSDAITNDQVAQVVDLIIGQDGGVAAEQAVELVSSAKVLESVSGDQATEVFGSVDEGALTAENGEQITAAVQEAPVAVRDAFQEEINVFGGVFDGYYPLGSMIEVLRIPGLPNWQGLGTHNGNHRHNHTPPTQEKPPKRTFASAT